MLQAPQYKPHGASKSGFTLIGFFSAYKLSTMEQGLTKHIYASRIPPIERVINATLLRNEFADIGPVEVSETGASCLATASVSKRPSQTQNPRHLFKEELDYCKERRACESSRT